MPLPSRTEARAAGTEFRVALTVWALAATFYAFGFFLRVSPSVMTEELMLAFGVTAGAVGGLSATYFYAYAGLQLPIGLLLDRWGARRVFVGAALLCAAGSVLFGLSQQLLTANIGRVLLGAGSGVAWVGCLKLIAHWFPPHRFALLSGIALSMGMFGAVGGQAPLAAAIAALGWRPTMLLAGVIAAVLALLLLQIPRDEPRDPGPVPEPSDEVPLLPGLRRVLTDPQSWYAACYGSLMTVPMLGFATLWGVPYLVERFGVGRPAAGLATSLLMVGWGFGAPLYGWLSGRNGQRRRLMITGASINLVTIVLALYVPGLSFGAVAALLFLNGLGSGSMPLCFAHARSQHPPQLAASTFGFVNTLVIALAAAVQPLIGVVMDLGWDGRTAAGARLYDLATYQTALLLVPASVAVALVLSVLLREPAATPVGSTNAR